MIYCMHSSVSTFEMTRTCYLALLYIYCLLSQTADVYIYIYILLCRTDNLYSESWISVTILHSLSARNIKFELKVVDYRLVCLKYIYFDDMYCYISVTEYFVCLLIHGFKAWSSIFVDLIITFWFPDVRQPNLFII